MCEYVLEVEPNKLREFTIAINFILRILEGALLDSARHTWLDSAKCL